LFIQINTDNQIPSDAGRDAQIEEQVRQRLARFEERITDVEIHVSDVNGPRGGAATCAARSKQGSTGFRRWR
jgi:hypothetical protein